MWVFVEKTPSYLVFSEVCVSCREVCGMLLLSRPEGSAGDMVPLPQECIYFLLFSGMRTPYCICDTAHSQNPGAKYIEITEISLPPEPRIISLGHMTSRNSPKD